MVNDVQAQSGQTDVAADQTNELQAALLACSQDRAALQGLLGQLFKDFKTETLRVIEEILKYDPQTADAAKQRLFSAYRSRILNAGGCLDRQLPMVLKDFVIKQVFTTEVVVRKVNTPFRYPVEKRA